MLLSTGSALWPACGRAQAAIARRRILSRQPRPSAASSCPLRLQERCGTNVSSDVSSASVFFSCSVLCNLARAHAARRSSARVQVPLRHPSRPLSRRAPTLHSRNTSARTCRLRECRVSPRRRSVIIYVHDGWNAGLSARRHAEEHVAIRMLESVECAIAAPPCERERDHVRLDSRRLAAQQLELAQDADGLDSVGMLEGAWLARGRSLWLVRLRGVRTYRGSGAPSALPLSVNGVVVRHRSSRTALALRHTFCRCTAFSKVAFWVSGACAVDGRWTETDSMERAPRVRRMLTRGALVHRGPSDFLQWWWTRPRWSVFLSPKRTV